MRGGGGKEKGRMVREGGEGGIAKGTKEGKGKG